jgi:hypothetical protein
MRTRLAESLRYVVAQAGGALPIPPALEGFLERLVRGPVDPQAFGAYYELVLALEDDEIGQAVALLDEIAVARSSGELEIRSLVDPDLCRLSRRYRRLIDTDPSWPLELVPPDPASVESTREHIGRALARLDRSHPELAGELRALIREIVLASAASTRRGETFDGVSSFMLWGGLVLRAGSHVSELEMLEALAHEGAHSLLFGLSTDGPMLANDDVERFPSPLRRDPRPLDGILHATFVTARMHHALRHLRDVEALAPDERDWVGGRLEAHAKNFEEGLAVIDAHARLTPAGAAALGAARSYMADA